MNREEILEKAKAIVTGERESAYGSPEDNFATIAELWSVFLDIGLDSEDVATMMILLKVARIRGGQAKADNWVDVAGYAACGGEIQSREKEAGETGGTGTEAPNEERRTFIRCSRNLRPEDFREWEKVIKEQDDNIVCIPCDAEVVEDAPGTHCCEACGHFDTCAGKERGE